MVNRFPSPLADGETRHNLRTMPSTPLSARGTRRSQSFLVRVWVEPREVTGEADPVRTYVRNLRTGEESYLNDPSELGAYLARQTDDAQRPGDLSVLRNGTDGDATLG